MVGLDQSRKTAALEKVLGLISKCGISDVTKTLWRERRNGGGTSLQNLHSGDSAMAWAEDAAQGAASAVLLCSTSSIAAPERLLCVSRTATKAETHTRGKRKESHTRASYFSTGQRPTGVGKLLYKRKKSDTTDKHL